MGGAARAPLRPRPGGPRLLPIAKLQELVNMKREEGGKRPSFSDAEKEDSGLRYQHNEVCSLQYCSIVPKIFVIIIVLNLDI